MVAAHVVDLARGTPTVSGTLYAWWLLYGAEIFLRAVAPGLLVAFAPYFAESDHGPE
jgi:hypothetical protein